MAAIPSAPSFPTSHTVDYVTSEDVSTFGQAWLARDAAQTAEIARLNALLAAQTTVRYGIDLSDLTGDEPLSEAAKVNSHRQAGLALTNVRVFFGSGRINWGAERIKALDPTQGDSIVISTLSTDIAGLTTDLKNTPDEWRTHVDLCNGHEREANLLNSANPDAAVADWLAGCDAKATMLDGLGSWGYSSDNFGKIGLWYTQEHGKLSMRQTRERFYGGQNFGWFGEDCYHLAQWVNTGRYTTAEELFGPICDFTDSIGLPCRIPEWGSVVAEGDTDGSGRAAAITEGGAYLKSRGVKAANWWCGTGSTDKTQPKGYRDFHLEGTPALAAYLAL